LVVAAEGRTARLWEAATGKGGLTLRGHEGEVLALAWAPDGRRLASGSADSTIKVWDAASGKEGVTLRGHLGEVRSLAWSPEGRRLASVDRPGGPVESPGTLELWDVATGQELATWPGQTGPVTWSPDGRFLASVAGGSDDKALTIWDAPRPDDKPPKRN